jgi:hypothetical protein
MAKKRRKTPKELRKFGVVMFVPLAVVAVLLWWKGRPASVYLGALAGFFLASGLLLPQILRPIEWAWMKFAAAMGAVMTRFILTLAFFIVMTPIGLAMRLAGKSSLSLKPQSDRPTYWIPADSEGSAARPDKPF